MSQMCYNSNTWLVVCGNSGFYKSADGGSTWTLLFSATDIAGYACTYKSNLNLYVISGASTGTKISSDLVTFTPVTTNYNELKTRLFSVNNYIIKCSESHVEYSTNGSTWTNSLFYCFDHSKYNLKISTFNNTINRIKFFIRLYY